MTALKITLEDGAHMGFFLLGGGSSQGSGVFFVMPYEVSYFESPEYLALVPWHFRESGESSWRFERAIGFPRGTTMLVIEGRPGKLVFYPEADGSWSCKVGTCRLFAWRQEQAADGAPVEPESDDARSSGP